MSNFIICSFSNQHLESWGFFATLGYLRLYSNPKSGIREVSRSKDHHQTILIAYYKPRFWAAKKLSLNWRCMTYVDLFCPRKQPFSTLPKFTLHVSNGSSFLVLAALAVVSSASASGPGPHTESPPRKLANVWTRDPLESESKWSANHECVLETH